MTIKSVILGACATGMAVTGAFASFFSLPVSGYVQYNNSTYPAQDGIACSPVTGSTTRCQVKTVDRNGVTLSTTTTLFSNSSASTAIFANNNSVKGTVVIPVN